MFDYLKRQYEKGFLTVTNIHKAVVKAWITTDQYKQITGQEYVA